MKSTTSSAATPLNTFIAGVLNIQVTIVFKKVSYLFQYNMVDLLVEISKTN